MARIKGVLGKVVQFFKKLGVKKSIILGVILLVAAGWFIFSRNKANGDIETSSVEKGSVSEDLILTGSIKADNHAKLTFPTSGKISWVGVKEGDTVKKGQALISLDKTTLNAAYQQALNNVRMYEADVDYVHDSLKNKDSTETFAEKDTRTTAEVAKDNAYDALKAAEYNLRNSTLYSPFEGMVTFLAYPYSGINTFVTDTQVEVVDTKTIFFEVSADQNEVTNISEDQDVKIVFDSFPDKEFTGKVKFISLTPNTAESGTVYKIKVSLEPNAEFDQIKIGMTGDARFSLNRKDNVLYVPNGFIKSDKKGKYLSVGSVKNKVYIETGLEGEETTEVSGDIKEGDTIFD